MIKLTVDFHEANRVRDRGGSATRARRPDDLAHLGVAEAKQDESSALVPGVVRFVHGTGDPTLSGGSMAPAQGGH